LPLRGAAAASRCLTTIDHADYPCRYPAGVP
jgi:hypothetical protein